MAWLFDGTNDSVKITDNSVLDFPDGDWTLAGWVKLTNNTGSAWNVIADWKNGANNPEVRLWIGEASTASYANDFILWSTDTDGADSANVGDGDNNNYFSANTSWTHLILQRSGTTVTIYKNNGSSNSRVSANYDGVAIAADWYFGASDTATTNFLAGSLAEWAKWDRALTSDERASLANGYSPSFYRNSLSWYVPMLREYIEVKAGLTVTNNGSTVTDHPRIIYPAYTLIGKAAPTTQTISLSGLASTSALGTSSVKLNINLSGLLNSSAFGSPVLVLNVSPTGIASTTALGTQSILLNITANGVASTTAIGTAVVANTQIISLSGLASTSALGTPSIKLNIDLSGLVNSSVFGSPAIVLNVSPSGFANTSTTGTPDIRLRITATGLANTQGFGSPTLSYEQVIALLGIPSTTVIGTHIIADTHVIVTTGLDSSTVFGTPVVFTRNFEVITPTTGDFVRVDV